MKKILAVVLLSAAATPAFAGSVDLSGFYAGATLGVGSANFTAPVAGYTVENPKNKPVYGVFGGYRYNKNLAVEMAYTGASYLYTTPTVGGARTLSKQIVFALTAVGTMPVSDSFSVFGKLGVASASSENNAAGEQNTRRFAPTFGAGVEYKFTPNISGRFGVDVYGVTATLPGTVPAVKQNSNATVMNAGVSYSF